jgi:hypothetical protein
MSTKAPSIWRPSPFKDELSLVLHRITMMVGALAYALFIAQLLILNNILLYSASALLGVGAALIWTGQVGSFSWRFYFSWFSSSKTVQWYSRTRLDWPSSSLVGEALVSLRIADVKHNLNPSLHFLNQILGKKIWSALHAIRRLLKQICVRRSILYMQRIAANIYYSHLNVLLVSRFFKMI